MFRYDCPECPHYTERVCESKRDEDRVTHEARCNAGRRQGDGHG